MKITRRLRDKARDDSGLAGVTLSVYVLIMTSTLLTFLWISTLEQGAQNVNQSTADAAATAALYPSASAGLAAGTSAFQNENAQHGDLHCAPPSYGGTNYNPGGQVDVQTQCTITPPIYLPGMTQSVTITRRASSPISQYHSTAP